MKFMLTWKLNSDAKMDAFAAFSQMTPEDDAADHGPDITMIGRWHDMTSGTGYCVQVEQGTAFLNLKMLKR